jgi:hypothetical protein
MRPTIIEIYCIKCGQVSILEENRFDEKQYCICCNEVTSHAYLNSKLEIDEA